MGIWINIIDDWIMDFIPGIHRDMVELLSCLFEIHTES